MEELLEVALDFMIPLCELMGLTVVAVSTFGAFFRYLRGLLIGGVRDIKFRLAEGLALSLEFKMAAEILKTVQVRSLSELAMLGVVIVLRALLSFLIHMEMRQIDHPVPKTQTENGGT